MGRSKEPTERTTPLTEADLDQIRAHEITPDANRQASVLIHSRDGIRVVSLVEGQSVLVGRAPPATVAIRDSSHSREHARFFMRDGEVWVEDLDSTNGTRIDGQRIDRCRILPDTRLSLGAVLVSVHPWDPLEGQQCGLDGHDRFLSDLGSEVSRSQTFGHSLALLMVRARGRRSPGVETWLLSWTRWESCRPRPRRRCSASSKPSASRAWAPAGRSRWTCGSWRPRTGIWAP